MHALLSENQYNKSRNLIPVQTTTAVLSPLWRSITDTVGEIQVPRGLIQMTANKIRNQISASEKQVQEGARFFYLSLKNGEHGTKEKLFIYCTSQRSFPDLWLLVLDHD